jgi:putative hemolysin
LAERKDEVRAALRLRFEVFNLELNEGLESAYLCGYDEDCFDAVCDHLIVEHVATGKVVGTYRLQTGVTAGQKLGYYSEREFDFGPYEVLRPQLVELGRACIHREHRSTDVLHLLWRGIAEYAIQRGSRFLIGCSSLTSQDAARGTAVYKRLLDWQVQEPLRTVPCSSFAMPLVSSSSADDSVPKLLSTYLAIGARICGPPALDREFKTIDFLTLLDLERLHPKIRTRFFGN